MYRLHGFFTQNTLKPLYVLEALEVDYEFRFVNLFERENFSEEFKRMTPVGKVPVLEHDGEFLFESGAICRYVANVENSPLYPQDKLQRARVDQWMDFFTCHAGHWLSMLYFERVIKPRAGIGEPNADQCAKAEKFASEQLAVVDSWLGEHGHLANGQFSIADLFAFAYLEQAPQVDFSLDGLTHLQSWYAKLDSSAAVQRARERVKQ
ncbi:glutathione S-transferase family protein [Elongatibacter sediminis]|uniref:Glutathione S-transferase family protein n=1 Tax=Elongatibacter sediminis TaxID=3119006 RepID=A0AAW9R8J9_9GAMM